MILKEKKEKKKNTKVIAASIKKEPLTPQEILLKQRNALQFLQIKKKMGRLIYTHQIKETKKQIARILTYQNKEKQKEGQN